MRGVFKITMVMCACTLGATLLAAGTAGAVARGGLARTTAVASSDSAATVPNTNIKATGGTDVYSPTKLNATYYGTKSKSCTTKRLGVTFTNKTAKTEIVTYGGTTFDTIPKGDVGGACFYGSSAHKFVFGIKGSKSKLTVSVSP